MASQTVMCVSCKMSHAQAQQTCLLLKLIRISVLGCAHHYLYSLWDCLQMVLILENSYLDSLKTANGSNP